jgi:predicted RNA polymerase sigma factor
MPLWNSWTVASPMPVNPNLPPPDALDIAMSEILGVGNAYAYSAIATVRRYLHSFRLAHLVEPHEILFEAYLRGKNAQRKGEIIYNPHAWLKRTAFNIVREKSRKARRQATQSFEEIEYRMSAESDCLLEKIDLSHEISLLYKALREFSREDSHTAQLLEWRTIERLSWTEIADRLVAAGETVPNYAALRQRVSRAKKRIRHILHGLGLPMR